MYSQQMLKDLLPEVIEIARQAGQIIMDIYCSDFQINNKSDDTPVTCADLAANEFIVAALAKLNSDIPILSEESTKIPYKERSQWQTYWLVDPLDGTRAFIEKTDEFSVNIALVNKNSPILGVIYSPVKKCSFYARQDNGAFYLDDARQPRSIQVRKKCHDKIIVAGTEKSAQSPILQTFLNNMEKKFSAYEIKFMGSSLKSCMVAEGIADVYARLGPTSEWDTAAAQCIVEEAGGLITDTQMRVLRYNTKDSLLNPDFFVFGDKSVSWDQFL